MVVMDRAGGRLKRIWRLYLSRTGLCGHSDMTAQGMGQRDHVLTVLADNLSGS